MDRTVQETPLNVPYQRVVGRPGTRVVSREVAQHVLWHLGDYTWGVQPGDFETRLMLAIDAADSDNRALLEQLYPEHVEGLRGMDLAKGTVARVEPVAGGVQMVLVKLAHGGEVRYGAHTGYIVKAAS